MVQITTKFKCINKKIKLDLRVVETFNRCNLKTSLLRRLQAQTLPDEAPTIGKIHPFSKIVNCQLFNQ